MNLPIYESQIAKAKEVRARLFSTPVEPVAKPLPAYSRRRLRPGVRIYFHGNLAPPEGVLRKPMTASWRVKLILNAVAHKYRHTGVTVNDMKSPRRDRAIIPARFEAIWRIKHKTMLSLPQIGRIFNRDHTTIIHAIRKHEERMAQELAARWTVGDEVVD